MRLDGPLGGSQLGADLLVQQTAGYQGEDFAFAGGKRAQELFQLDPPELFGAPFARELGAACYRAQQSAIVKRLLEEIHSTVPHRMHPERQITVTGDENDRCVPNCADEFLLQLKAVHSGQVDVRQDAVEFARIRRLEKFFRAAVRGGLEAGSAELEDEGLPQTLVIFDYCNPDHFGRSQSFDVPDLPRAATLSSNRSLCR